MSIAANDFERYCRGCRHLLRGVVSGRCPECGRGFNPNDSRTTTAYPHGDFLEFLRLLARTQLAIAMLVAVVVVFSSAFGQDYLFLPLMFALAAGLIVLPTLLIVAMAAKVPLGRNERIAAVVLVALIISVLYTHWPLRINFVLHKSALERTAAEARERGTGGGPHWIGILPIKRVKLYESEGERSVGIQLSGRPGGGMFLVQRQRGARFLWYNSCIVADLGGEWYLMHED